VGWIAEYAGPICGKITLVTDAILPNKIYPNPESIAKCEPVPNEKVDIVMIATSFLAIV
jgi:hypothetical protein